MTSGFNGVVPAAEKGDGPDGEEGPSLSISMELRRVSSRSAAAAAAAMFAESLRSSSGGRFNGCELGSRANRPPLLAFFDSFDLSPGDAAAAAAVAAAVLGVVDELSSRLDLADAAPAAGPAAAGAVVDGRGAGLLLDAEAEAARGEEVGDEGVDEGCGLVLSRR